MQRPRRPRPFRREIFRGQGAGRDTCRMRPFPGDAELCGRRDVVRAGRWIGAQPATPELQPIGGGLSIPENTHRRLHDSHLASLLTGLGGRLLSLRLRDRPFITDEGIGGIAVACTRLQELDIGQRTGRTGNRIIRTGNITGQALATLSAATCAPLLVCLGLRNRHCVGNMDLRSLGTCFPSLRRLDLAGLVKVDDDVLRALASTLSLTHIDISSRAHRVTASGVSALAVGSPELACISVHGTALADGAIRALCDACPKLRHINLSLTRVTERSLRLLAMKDSLRWINVRCCSGIGNDAVTAKVLADFRSRLLAPKHPRDRGTVLGMERPEPQSRTRAPSCSPRKPLSANSTGSGKGSGGGGYQGPPDDLGQDLAIHAQAALALRPSSTSSKRLHRFAPGNGGNGGGTRNASSDVENGNGSILRGDAPIDANGNAGGATKGGRAPPSADEGGCARRLGTPGAVLRSFDEGKEIVPRSSCEGPGGSRASPVMPVSTEGLPGDSSQGTIPIPSPVSLLVASTSPAQVGLGIDERDKERRAAATRQEGKGRALAEEVSAVKATAAVDEAVPPFAGEPASVSSRDHPPPPPPLLPAGVGDLSLGRHRRRGGSRSSSLREGERESRGSAGTESQGGRHGDARGRGAGGKCRVEEEAVVPFDWDTVPRGSGVGVLGSWKGFRGLSGDLVKNIIRELHPHAQVEFRPTSDSLLGPPSRKSNHGYLVHTSKFGQAWVEFEVDDQGCVA
ncbi:unnamed protein product [Ectocarpus fasciculatus]